MRTRQPQSQRCTVPGCSILARIYAHAEPDLLFPVKHGEALHHELELLIGAGLSTVDALRVVTSLPVKCFNQNGRSVIEVGKRAGLVLISQDLFRTFERQVQSGGFGVVTSRPQHLPSIASIDSTTSFK